MKIIQTRYKYENLLSLYNEPLAVMNVGMFIDIDFMHIPIHQFRSYLLIYCKNGTVQFERTDADDEYLESGFIKVIPPNTPVNFSYMGQDSNEYYFIHYSGTLAKELTECVFTDSDTVYIGNRPDIAKSFNDIEKSFELMEQEHESRALLLKNMFYTIMKTQNRKSVRSMQRTLDISRVIVYIQDNYHKKLTVDELKGMCYVCKDHFMRLFRKMTGYTVIEYITNIRVEEAKKLLKSLSYTIREVAGEVGYQNEFYFSRVFKSKVGIPPSEYRDKCAMEAWSKIEKDG